MTKDDKARQIRRGRDRRATRARGHQSGSDDPPNFFASPQLGLFCLLVALASVVAFWQGLPPWALLALGIGGVLVVAVGAALVWARRR